MCFSRFKLEVRIRIKTKPGQVFTEESSQIFDPANVYDLYLVACHFGYENYWNICYNEYICPGLFQRIRKSDR